MSGTSNAKIPKKNKKRQLNQIIVPDRNPPVVPLPLTKVRTEIQR